MKRIVLFALLTALFWCASLPAGAEESALSPYDLARPDGVTVTVNEGSLTYVLGQTRAVAQVISRVPDEDPADALPRLMAQFDPDAVFGPDLTLAEGFFGMTAVTAGKYGEGVDLHTAMVLREGELLILSAYDMSGDPDAAAALLDLLLQAVSLDGTPILLPPEDQATP